MTNEGPWSCSTPYQGPITTSESYSQGGGWFCSQWFRALNTTQEEHWAGGQDGALWGGRTQQPGLPFPMSPRDLGWKILLADPSFLSSGQSSPKPVSGWCPL